VRKLFLVSGLVMLATLPFFLELISVPLFMSVVAIVVLAFLAGLESPHRKLVIILNTVAAVVGCLVFQYQAASYYLESTSSTIDWWFLITNQALAAVFFFALYFSSKTVRSLGKEK
jgi:hypothetical protein